MSTPDKINAAQKAKVAKKYPGAVANPDIFIGGSGNVTGSKPKQKRVPKLPVFKVREVRDKMA